MKNILSVTNSKELIVSGKITIIKLRLNVKLSILI